MNALQTKMKEIQSQIVDEFVFGNKQLLEHMLVAYFARGHLLLEGPPGTAKTMTAKLLAQLLSKGFRRIQFTSDLLPQDILGTHIFNPKENEFRFVRGPLFSDFVIADEINRAPPRTQSALLEAMEERQVTLEGQAFELSKDFFVMATQNPQDHEGTFPLPEVQLDRFLMKLHLNHQAAEIDFKILEASRDGKLPPQFSKIKSLQVSRDEIENALEHIKIDESLLRYISKLLEETRRHPMLRIGSSVRGGIGLMKCSRVLAMLRERDFVIPDDVKELAKPVLRHRLQLGTEALIANAGVDQVLDEILQRVQFPK